MSNLKAPLEHNSQKSTSLQFIVLLGTVSFFCDLAYEAARSIMGPYLLSIGATGTIVGLIAGLSELVAYGMRIVFGAWTQRSQKLWPFTLIGYGMTFICLPLLGWVKSWPIAGGLIVFERFGKAARVPARDTMLSYAAHAVGRGKGFGLHQVLDQLGGVVGPLTMTLLLFYHEAYSFLFMILIIPSSIAFLVLLSARMVFPEPKSMEPEAPTLTTPGFSSTFWVYLIGLAFVGAGFADFPLMAFHLVKDNIVPAFWVPVMLVIGMLMSAISAYLYGIAYDRFGFKILIVSIFVSLLFAPCVFLGDVQWIVLGMILWGLGLGAQRSLQKAILANMIPPNQRALGYGIMQAIFGVGWFIGSVVIGVLYDYSLYYLVAFSVLIQLISVPLLLFAQRQLAKS